MTSPWVLKYVIDGVSQGISRRQLAFYGGNGYTYLHEVFLPRLRAAGVGEAEIQRITVENPRAILAIEA